MSSNVDEYIEQFDGIVRERLETIRSLLRSELPDAVESISYGMPTYKLQGHPVVYFAGYPKHIGFYATPNGHEAFANDFARYKQGKGSVQFPHDRPLPIGLIKRVALFRRDHINTVKE